MPTTPNEPDTAELARLVEQRLSVLEQLHAICQRQIDVIDDGDTSRLMTLLVAKQKLLSALHGIEESLDPFRRQDPAQRRWASPEARAGCQRTADRCAELLDEITKLERDAEAELTRQQAATAQRLDGLGQAHHARTAYLQGTPPTSRQLDLDAG